MTRGRICCLFFLRSQERVKLFLLFFQHLVRAGFLRLLDILRQHFVRIDGTRLERGGEFIPNVVQDGELGFDIGRVEREGSADSLNFRN